MRDLTFLLILSLMWVSPAIAQSPTAAINGIVLDPSGAAIAGAQVVVVNDATGVQYTTKTNGEGIYVVPNLPPGPYRIQVSNSGFKTIIKPDIVIHVQDALAINFTLPIGAASEVVTVQGGAPLVNTESAAVSTVVDRQFAENLPMNGRSFQTLIQLAPGVVLTASNPLDSGQFNVNGQRAAANYWMVDGVSANFGVSANNTPGNGLGGTLASFSTLGGTNSLVSVDALQEFRIQTSTYAPEFGRTPGGQISIVTRSGTNQFHGTVFEYLRNDVLDANDWFANANQLAKPKERQNDFGGTFSGPILKDKTFFFFSYEGLRLRLPQVTLSDVPDMAARQNAMPAVQPFLNAFPFDPAQPNLGNGIAEFNASYSNAATLNAYSLRMDHKFGKSWNLFGRYNYSPSEIEQRGNGFSLNTISPSRITTQTATVGATWIVSPSITNDLRFNYSRANARSFLSLDHFGGAVPLDSLPFPSPFTSQNGLFAFRIFSLGRNGALQAGQNLRNLQRQINIVDALSLQKGSHSLRFGVDFRRLSPVFDPSAYTQNVFFGDVPSAENGNPFFSIVAASLGPTFLFRNLGIYAQDTWRIIPRLTITYGLRWEVDFVPQSLNGPEFPALTGFNLTNLSNLDLAPVGTSPYKTTYGNFAPRFGLAYQLFQSQEWLTVIRGGLGVFYDLATSEMGNSISSGTYPFGNLAFRFGAFPLSAAAAAPPLITPPSATSPGRLFAFDPHLKLPFTSEWNVALEQNLGKQQTVSASYIGAAGRRLLQSALANSPTANISTAQLVTNGGTSDYSALQVQFQRRLSPGLQGLASYTWAHSIDTGSAGSTAIVSNGLLPSAVAGSNRGPSDFDIRNMFTAGVTYEIPAPESKGFANAILRGWSTENFVIARTAPPVNIDSSIYNMVPVDTIGGFQTLLRPDVVPGQPLYLYGSQFPGGRAFNPAAFTAPPIDSATGTFLQGNLGRNALRGFGAIQWDFAVHRDIAIRESLKLQFRAELFNVLNHPNFGPPEGTLSDLQFGLSTKTLGQYLSGGNVGGGGFSALYQIGGPRSVQFALKLIF